MKRNLVAMFCLLGLGAHTVARAEENACFDLKIAATPVKQVATELPKDPDIIVISWPWFVEFQFYKFVDGELREKAFSAQAVLHSMLPATTQIFLFRKNHLGGMNMLRVSDLEAIPECSAEIEPMQSYISPPIGMTLSDYRQELLDADEFDQDEQSK